MSPLPQVEMSGFTPCERGREGLARAQPLLLPPAQLRIGQPGGVPLALLGGDPGEDRAVDVRARESCRRSHRCS